MEETAFIFVAKELGRIADALTWLAKIEQARFDKAYPPEKLKRDAIITRPDEEKRELISDKPSEKWLRETEAALPKSRFRERFESPQTGDGKGNDAQAGSAAPVAGKARGIRAVSKNK